MSCGSVRRKSTGNHYRQLSFLTPDSLAGPEHAKARPTFACLGNWGHMPQHAVDFSSTNTQKSGIYGGGWLVTNVHECPKPSTKMRRIDVQQYNVSESVFKDSL